MRQKSKWILSIVALSIATGLAAYVAHVKAHVMMKPSDIRRPLKIVKGETFKKSYDLSYEHLHVTIPEVKIDARYKDHIELSGFEVAQDIAQLDVCNDTLYVSYSEKYTPKMVGTDALLALKIHVGGRGLKSITVNGAGSIITPVKPVGTGKDGKYVYKEEDKERYVLKFDTLKIINGPVSMHLEGRHLEIKKANVNLTNLSFIGSVESLSLNYSKGNIRMSATDLQCNIARINTEKNTSGLTAGDLQLSVRDSLYANLYGPLDINYYGDPVVKKYERYTGRVVHQYETEEGF